jgi:hypothetical protein
MNNLIGYFNKWAVLRTAHLFSGSFTRVSPKPFKPGKMPS